jgi:hypothetical protein
MKGPLLHRRIGVLMKLWPGYWPLAIDVLCALTSFGLYSWAGWAIEKPMTDEFYWFFGLIGVWSTLRLGYDYWHAGWLFLWLFRKDRLEYFYRKVRGWIRRIPFRWSGALADYGEQWLRRRVRGIRGFGPKFRKRLTFKVRAAAYLPAFLYGLVPILPKFPTVALCRAGRWESGLFVLAVGNFLRVGLTLGGVLGTREVFSAGWRILKSLFV